MRVSVNNALAGIRPQVKNLLLDFSSVNFIDVSACDELLTLIKKLQNQGVTIAFARVRDDVRENMRLGGIEACRQMRDGEASAGATTLMLTAAHGDSVERQAKAAGAYLLLTKPFSALDLLWLVARLGEKYP